MSAASIVVAVFSPSRRGDLPSPRSRCLVVLRAQRRAPCTIFLRSGVVSVIQREACASRVLFICLRICVYCIAVDTQQQRLGISLERSL